MELLTRTAVKFPATYKQMQSKGYLDEMMAEWGDVVRRFSLRHLQWSVGRCLDELNFFPTKKDLLDRMPTEDELNPPPTRAHFKRLFHPGCTDCHGTGWKNLGGKEQRHTRCPCYRPEGYMIAPYTAEEMREFDAARESEASLTLRNAVRQLRGQEPMTLAEHVKRVRDGKENLEAEIKGAFRAQSEQKRMPEIPDMQSRAAGDFDETEAW